MSIKKTGKVEIEPSLKLHQIISTNLILNLRTFKLKLEGRKIFKPKVTSLNQTSKKISLKTTVYSSLES